MLVLSRSAVNESHVPEKARVIVTCRCGCRGTVEVEEIERGRVRLGFAFPESVRIDRAGQNGYLRLSVDVGADRHQLVGTPALPPSLREPEIEWLHEVLMAWKEQA